VCARAHLCVHTSLSVSNVRTGWSICKKFSLKVMPLYAAPPYTLNLTFNDTNMVSV
jgi:hypothetical protein